MSEDLLGSQEGLCCMEMVIYCILNVDGLFVVYRRRCEGAGR